MIIAYCGLNCETCPIHLATLEQDLSKQKTMRTEIARLCREQYSMEFQFEDITDCDGCQSGTNRLFSGCMRCEIRKCAAERKLTSCGYCNDYACEKLLKFFETDPSAKMRLETLRRSS